MLLSYAVDWQVLTDDLDHQVRQDWMVIVESKEPEGTQGLEVEMVYLAETALQVNQVWNSFESLCSNWSL